MYKKTKLENGLRIVSRAMPAMQSVSLGIFIKVGGRNESGANKGISHYLEHLLFKGSKKYSCRKIKESIEGVGGSLNGFTCEEVTCYLAKLPARHLGLAFDILSDMVRHPLLNREDIEKERTVILEEAKMYKDLPQSYVHELLDGLLWPRQPLGMPIIGSVESISRIKRTDLLSFRGRNYIPGNIVVSAAGMLEHERLAELAAESFSFFRDTAANKFLQAKEEQAKPQLNLLDKNTEQTHVALGFHSFRRDHPLKYAVGLLHTILGANMSSRLFNELREKRGLAYEIGTQVKRFQDTGAFVVHAGIDNRKVCPTIRLILDELQKTKVKLASPAELKRAKEFYLGQLMLALEDTLDHMLWIGESTVTLDRTYLLDEVINEVSRLKCEDVREAARCIFREKNLNLALIGPLKDSRDRISRQLCLRQP